VAHLLAEGLVRRGHDVTLFASGDSLTSARLESAVPRPLGDDPAQPSRACEALHIVHAYERAAALGLEVLHNHAGVYATVLSRLSPAPVLTTLHGSAAEKDSRMIYARYREQAYVSVTAAERGLAPELNYVGTVHNGIDTHALPEPREPDDYLLYVGRISPDKGVHHAVRVSQLTGRRLILSGIVADGDKAYYESRIAPFVDGERVQFVGPCDTGQRNELMRGACAFLHLVEYHEAFGLTMVEAMAIGAPVIAFRRGSVPELVRDGRTGYIVDTVEGAAEAVDRSRGLDRRACAAWARDEFSEDRMVEGYERVYEKLVRGRRGR
jgi:glycosyltransferase involved in cell wall biosynthesis